MVKHYTVLEGHQTSLGMSYYFASKGNDNIIKAVDYSYLMKFKGLKVYNLAFGDYNAFKDELDDEANSQNGDVYKVFNTVLSTIPAFFDSFPNSMMIVKGSDSSPSFIQRCKLTCNRNCIDRCKKSHRRINVYLGYVNKNFNELIKRFTFYGGIENSEQIKIENYVPGKKYDAVLVYKKKV